VNSPSSILALRCRVAEARLVLVLAAFLCCAGSWALGACLEWQNLGAAAGPWQLMTLVYDEVRGEVVGLSVEPQDDRVNLLRFRANAWAPVDSQVGVFPEGPRFGFGACYHRGRGTVLLFGGYTGLGGAARARNDFWEWNGTAWTEIKHAGPWPTATGDDELMYDPHRNRVILLSNVGNVAGGNAGTWEVWEWTGSAWEKGARISSLGSRVEAVFDEFNKSVFVYTHDRSAVFERMWRFTPGATAEAGVWRQLPVSTEFEAQVGASLVYDPYRRTIIRPGGAFCEHPLFVPERHVYVG
jgi:hypothetical protein